MSEQENALQWKNAAEQLRGVRDASRQLFAELDQPMVHRYLRGTSGPGELDQLSAMMRERPEVERSLRLARKALRGREMVPLRLRRTAEGLELLASGLRNEVHEATLFLALSSSPNMKTPTLTVSWEGTDTNVDLHFARATEPRGCFAWVTCTTRQGGAIVGANVVLSLPQGGDQVCTTDDYGEAGFYLKMGEGDLFCRWSSEEVRFRISLES